jgi:hypothetical protein
MPLQHHGRMGLHGRLRRHGYHSCQVATVTYVAQVAVVIHVATVAQVPTVAPRSSTADTLLLFNNSVRTAKKTQHFTITKINWLKLFKEIITVYTENHTKRKKKAYYRLPSR